MKVIGTSQERSFETVYWNTSRLEIGIFVTLVGTILFAFSLNKLISALKR